MKGLALSEFRTLWQEGHIVRVVACIGRYNGDGDEGDTSLADLSCAKSSCNLLFSFVNDS